jgi:maleate isomerase
MYGYRARIGYTSPPAVTETFAYEFYRIVPEGVTLAVTTLNIVHMTEEELAEGARISIDGARLLAQADVSVIILGGVPLNLALGLDGLERTMRELEDEFSIPVTSSLTAQVNALKVLGAGRVGVATPFQQDHDIYGHYLRHYGFEMAALEGAGRTVLNLALADDRQAQDLARRLMARDGTIDTLYYPAPHWGIIGMIDPLESEFGVNVVTSVQAIVWEGLRRAGVNDPIQDYGRLLREF